MAGPNQNVLRRYLQGQCTEEEKALVEAWYNAGGAANEHIDIEKVKEAIDSLDQRVIHSINHKPAYRTTIAKIVYAAASIVIIVGAWILFHLQNPKPLFAPEKNNVIISLGKNQEYDLTQLTLGDTLKTQAYIIIKKDKDAYQYIANDTSAQHPIYYNTIKTSAGGTAKILLTDGSSVWVNANSEITYPIIFQNDLRDIKLNGEAYFEIAKVYKHGKNVPFIIRTENNTLEVLGTKFNVSTYSNTYQVALLKGKVAIVNKKTEWGNSFDSSSCIYLAPGQLYNNDSAVKNIDNIDRYSDWQKGNFDFTDLDIYQICSKLENWYGVKIHIEPPIIKTIFYGQISREQSLNKVLGLIKELSNIDYKIKDKEVIINYNSVSKYTN